MWSSKIYEMKSNRRIGNHNSALTTCKIQSFLRIRQNFFLIIRTTGKTSLYILHIFFPSCIHWPNRRHYIFPDTWCHQNCTVQRELFLQFLRTEHSRRLAGYIIWLKQFANYSLVEVKLWEEYARSMIWPLNGMKTQQLVHDAVNTTLSHEGNV